eukprot:ctg_2635.g635
MESEGAVDGRPAPRSSVGFVGSVGRWARTGQRRPWGVRLRARASSAWRTVTVASAAGSGNVARTTLTTPPFSSSASSSSPPPPPPPQTRFRFAPPDAAAAAAASRGADDWVAVPFPERLERLLAAGKLDERRGHVLRQHRPAMVLRALCDPVRYPGVSAAAPVPLCPVPSGFAYGRAVGGGLSAHCGTAASGRQCVPAGQSPERGRPVRHLPHVPASFRRGGRAPGPEHDLHGRRSGTGRPAGGAVQRRPLDAHGILPEAHERRAGASRGETDAQPAHAERDGAAVLTGRSVRVVRPERWTGPSLAGHRQSGVRAVRRRRIELF